MPNFLGLPSELRHQIYNCALLEDHPLALSPGRNLRGQLHYHTEWSPLFAVSRQLRRECLQFFFSRNEFQVSLSDYWIGTWRSFPHASLIHRLTVTVWRESQRGIPHSQLAGLRRFLDGLRHIKHLKLRLHAYSNDQKAHDQFMLALFRPVKTNARISITNPVGEGGTLTEDGARRLIEAMHSAPGRNHNKRKEGQERKKQAFHGLPNRRNGKPRGGMAVTPYRGHSNQIYSKAGGQGKGGRKGGRSRCWSEVHEVRPRFSSTNSAISMNLTQVVSRPKITLVLLVE